MMRAEPRIFDPDWLYRPITDAFLRVAGALRNIQAGPLGLYLLYLLAAFVAAPADRAPARLSGGRARPVTLAASVSCAPRVTRPREGVSKSDDMWLSQNSWTGVEIVVK